MFPCQSLDAKYCAVSSIIWLENDVFLMVYTPNILQDDMGNPPSFYYIITRRKQQPFLIQKLPEVSSTMGFGMQRTPAYQFIARFRDYKPHLKDVLIVSSTASADVGLIVRSEQPLASDEESKALAGQFTVAEVSDDTKRASAPLTESAEETSVIGLVPDLSSSETVLTPIPGEDITESATPLPGLFHLNNDGVLSSWWFIYTDAIRQNVPYSGLVSAGKGPLVQAQSQPAAQAPAPAPAPAQQQPAFGQPSFVSPSPFGASAFGKPSGGATFGSPSSMGASTMGATAFGKPSFGSPSAMGGGTTPAFGKPSAPGPSFGTPSQPGTSFGIPSTVGQPQFGQSGFGGAGSAFGQPSTPAKSLLGSGPSTSSGGFSSFSGGGGAGFSGFAAAKPGESPFAKAPAGGSPFAQTSTAQSAFSKTSSTSPFGAKPSTDTAFPSKPTEVKNPFGAPSGGFKLESSFKGDGSAVNDLPKADKPSSDAFSFGGSFDEMVSTPSKPSPPAESMDDMEDAGAADQPVKTEPPSLFGATKPTSIFGQPTQPSKPPGETTKSAFSFGESNKSTLSLFGNTATTTTTTATSQNQVTSPVSAPSDKTATPKREQSVSTPPFSSLEAPLPPDPTSRDSYAPGDTSASSNVSKSSVEDAPLPPDFTMQKKTSPKEEEAPLPPDFLSQKKPSPQAEEAPLPPDFVEKPKEAASPSPVPEEAPLPPDFTISKAKEVPAEEAVPVPDGPDADSEQDADESDFSDSGEEINHDETEIPSPKHSVQSSFSRLSEKSSTGGLLSGLAKYKQKQQPPPPLFGELPTPPLLPPGPSAQGNREPHRSPSPTRVTSQKSSLSQRAETRPPAGTALSSRKASLTQMAQRSGQLRQPGYDAREEQLRAQQAAQPLEGEEVLSLSEDDEDERLRADLARPVEPVSTLDPFLPHQTYEGETAKPGIPGMIEKLYRDINSMIDTVGINDRSLKSFLLYQQDAQNSTADDWVDLLTGDQPTDILDKEFVLSDIPQVENGAGALDQHLQEQRVQGVDEKLRECRELLAKDIHVLRAQIASTRKTLDAFTDSGATRTAPLSAEQAALQDEIRSACTKVQAKTAELEQGASLLRAKIADTDRPDGVAKASRKKPTVEAVSATIATMLSMAESKSSEVDYLEAQVRKLGIDPSSRAPGSREGSPFTTPRKNIGRLPATPGSRGSLDGSAYHTPDSASRGANFRASINGSAKHSLLRGVEAAGPAIAHEERSRWKAKASRRQQQVRNLKKAFEEKETKVRSADD